jgi:hypothetical protein
MNNRDLFLLRYLAQFNKPVKIQESTATDDMRKYYSFRGLDVNRDMDSIWVRLHNLKNENIVEGSGQTWAITPFGREQYAELHWKFTGSPLGAIRVEMSLEEACEMIFDEHKQKGKIAWTKDSFKLTYSDKINDAQELMIRQGILYEKKEPIGKSFLTITRLEPSVMDAASYEEAKKVIAADKNKPQGNSIIMRDGIAMIGDQSNNDLDAFSPTHNPPTIAETKHGIIKTVIKFILNNIVLVIILGVIAGLIVAYYTHLFGWN